MLQTCKVREISKKIESIRIEIVDAANVANFRSYYYYKMFVFVFVTDLNRDIFLVI